MNEYRVLIDDKNEAFFVNLMKKLKFKPKKIRSEKEQKKIPKYQLTSEQAKKASDARVASLRNIIDNIDSKRTE